MGVCCLLIFVVMFFFWKKHICLSNETERALFDRLDVAVSKCVNEFKCKFKGDEIAPVVDALIIINACESYITFNK